MNIERANLSSSASSSAPVANISQPLVEGVVSGEGFSGALVAQVGLLSNVSASGLVGVQGVNGASVGATVDTQNVAALLSNNLPSSTPQEKNGHEAALLAVTDTLKYIATGTTVEEKAAEAAKNIQDVIAMAIPAQQNTTAAVSVQQNIKNVLTTTVSDKNNTKDGDIKAGAEKVSQNILDAVVSTITAPIELKQANAKADKKQVADEAQNTGVANNPGIEVLLPVVIPPVPVEQGKSANNLMTEDGVKDNTQPSFIKPSTGDAKPNPNSAEKTPDNVQQSPAVFGQAAQNKQDFTLKIVDKLVQVEKTGSVVQPGLSIDGEKTVPQGATDTTQPSRLVVDNKTDVPAIAKPLTHPEWSKDLGERIVWMANKAIPTAEIRLNPEHLGPISVRVNVVDDQASVVFTAQHAATREVIEASIPKLREMMNAQQLNLSEVNVSQSSGSDQGRSQSQNFAQTAEGRGQGGGVADGMDEVEQEIQSGRAVVSKGLLSIYA